MRRTPLVPTLILLASILAACGDDDSPSGPASATGLEIMATCAAGGIEQLGLVIETCLILFHELEDYPPYTPPIDFSYNTLTGGFSYREGLVADPSRLFTVSGAVAPLAVVEDGLHQHDVFTVTWEVRPPGGVEPVAAGVFRVNHNGLTSPPDQHETMRVIIAGDVWAGPVGGCRTVFNQFEMAVQHLRDDGEIRSASIGFTSTNPGEADLTGFLAVGAEDETATINGSFGGEPYSCSISLVNYAIDCAGD